MQRKNSADHGGRRTRVHTVALAIVFALLAVVASGPHVGQVRATPTIVAPTFPAAS